MDTLKPISELTAPDPRHKGFVLVDASAEGQVRPTTLEDLYSEIESLTLAESVPANVRAAFDLARMLWLHGWFYWPFHTAAIVHGILALDLALGLRIGREPSGWDGTGRKPSLTNMLDMAVENRWITDEGISYARRVAERGPFVRLDDFQVQANADDQAYTKLLARLLPQTRNAAVHPKGYWYTVPGHSLLILQNVRDIIGQLHRA